MTLPPRVEPTGAPAEPAPPTPKEVPERQADAPEWLPLRMDVQRSMIQLRSQWRKAEVGEDELAAAIALAKLLRELADGDTSGAAILERLAE